MLREEFESLTGFYPPQDMYELIEKKYMESVGDKLQFCEDFKANKDGMAEQIQREADMNKYHESVGLLQLEEDHKKEVEELKKRIKYLENKVRSIEGWRPYQVSKMSEEGYRHLQECKTDEFYAEEKVLEWIHSEFGFDTSQIKILNRIPKYEISRENLINRTGEWEDRAPAYCATDWHYVRFNTGDGMWQWEAVNGNLYQYAD